MFSTTEGASARFLHVFLESPGMDEELAIPEEIEDLARRAKALPSDANLKAVAEAALETVPPRPAAADAVRVEVWRTRFDPASLAPRSERIRALIIEVDRAGR